MSIEDALKPVASSCRGSADVILDLREAVLQRQRPGQCLQCYFKILQAATPEAPLDPLRKWLETHLEIVARNEALEELERLPLTLHGSDLESFCRGLMAEFRDNRSYDATAIELELDYKPAAFAA